MITYEQVKSAKKIVITGPIGSGKSTLSIKLAELFSQAHINTKILNYDILCHDVLENSEIVKSKELEAFGTTDRKVLASLIFEDKEKQAIQESIILPEVYKLALKLSDEALSAGRVVIHEIPVLAETHEFWPPEFTPNYFDLGIILDVSEDEAVARVTSKLDNPLPEQDIRNRFLAQASFEQRQIALAQVARITIKGGN